MTAPVVCAQSESRDWPMHRGNTGGIDSFLVVRRHTNTDNITDSSHSNDTLYSVRETLINGPTSEVAGEMAS
ncbi:hypothetical protein, partial [Burkholderia aenigmatica]